MSRPQRRLSRRSATGLEVARPAGVAALAPGEPGIDVVPADGETRRRGEQHLGLPLPLTLRVQHPGTRGGVRRAEHAGQIRPPGLNLLRPPPLAPRRPPRLPPLP